MTLTIIEMKAADGQNWRWRTGDGIFVSGEVALHGGKAAGTCTMVLADPDLALINTLPLPMYHAKTAVEVWMGKTNVPPKVFAGYVDTYESVGPPGTIHVTALDKFKGMRRVRRSRNLTESSPEDIIRRLVEPHGLKVDVTKANFPDVQFASVLQQGETDMQVATRLIEQIGHVAMTLGSTFYVIARGQTRTDGPNVTLKYGENVDNYTFTVADLTTHTTPNIYDITGASVTSTDGTIEAADRASQLERSGLTVDGGNFPSYTHQQFERAKKAQAHAKKIFKATIASTNAFGDAAIDDVVTLQGFGARFDGLWFVENLVHDLVRGRTTFDLYNGGSTA